MFSGGHSTRPRIRGLSLRDKGHAGRVGFVLGPSKAGYAILPQCARLGLAGDDTGHRATTAEMLPYSEIIPGKQNVRAGCRKDGRIRWPLAARYRGLPYRGRYPAISSIDATVKFDPLIGRVWHKAEKPHTVICGGVSPKGRQFKTDAAWLLKPFPALPRYTGKTVSRVLRVLHVR